MGSKVLKRIRYSVQFTPQQQYQKYSRYVSVGEDLVLVGSKVNQATARDKEDTVTAHSYTTATVPNVQPVHVCGRSASGVEGDNKDTLQRTVTLQQHQRNNGIIINNW